MTTMRATGASPDLLIPATAPAGSPIRGEAPLMSPVSVASELSSRSWSGRRNRIGGDVTTDEAWQSYERLLRWRVRPDTIHSYHVALHDLWRHLEQRGIRWDRVTPSDVEAWLGRRCQLTWSPAIAADTIPATKSACPPIPVRYRLQDGRTHSSSLDEKQLRAARGLTVLSVAGFSTGEVPARVGMASSRSWSARSTSLRPLRHVEFFRLPGQIEMPP